MWQRTAECWTFKSSGIFFHAHTVADGSCWRGWDPMALTHSARLPLLGVCIDSRANLHANTEISAAHFSMFFFLNNRGRGSKQRVVGKSNASVATLCTAYDCFIWVTQGRSKAIEAQILEHSRTSFLHNGSECKTDVFCLSLSYLVHLVQFAANSHQLMIWAGIKHQTLGLKMGSRSKSPVQTDSNCTKGKARESRNSMTSNDA
jgi:hypothetical protein